MAQFTRATAAYNDDGSQVAAGQPRYKILWQNLIKNGDARKDLSYWTDSINGASPGVHSMTRVYDDDIKKYCVEWSISAKSTWNVLQNNFYSYRTAPYFDITKQYILSFKIKVLSGSGVGVCILNGNGLRPVKNTAFTTNDGTWKRYTYAFTPIEAGDQPVVYITLTGTGLGTIRITDLQIIQDAIDYPFYDGINYGVLIEEGTTNILNGYTNMTTWEKGAAVSAVTVDAQTFRGKSVYLCALVAGPTSGYTFIRTFLTRTDGKPYTGTIYVKKVNHRYIGFRIFGSGPTGTNQSVLDLDTGTVYANNSEQTITAKLVENGFYEVVLKNAAVVTNSPYFGICFPPDQNGNENNGAVNGQQVLVAAYMSLEQKDYKTSYTDSSRGSENLKIPQKSLNPDAGTIEIDFNTLNKNPGPYPSFLGAGAWSSPSIMDWLAIYWGSGWASANSIMFSINNKNGTVSGGGTLSNINLQTFANYKVIARWSFQSKTWSFWLIKPDGTILKTNGTLIGTAPDFSGWNDIFIGSGWNNGGDKTNAAILSLKISDIYRTDAEIQGLAAGQAPELDANTTYLLTLDNNLGAQTFTRSAASSVKNIKGILPGRVGSGSRTRTGTVKKIMAQLWKNNKGTVRISSSSKKIQGQDQRTAKQNIVKTGYIKKIMGSKILKYPHITASIKFFDRRATVTEAAQRGVIITHTERRAEIKEVNI